MNKAKKPAIYLLIVFIALSVCYVFVNRSYNVSIGKSDITLKFGNNVSKEKTIKAPKNSEKLKFQYSDFNIKEGTLVIKLVSSQKEVILEKTLNPNSSAKDDFYVSNLKQDVQYLLMINGNENKQGSIKISWIYN